MAEKKRCTGVVEALQPRSIRLFNYYEWLQYSFKFRSSQCQWSFDDPFLVYHLCMYWKIELETLKSIYLRDPVVRFAVQTAYLQANTSPLGGIQPCHFWIQFSAIPEKILTTKTLTSEPEVSRLGILNLWVKKMGDTLQVKYGDKLEMIGKEVW